MAWPLGSSATPEQEPYTPDDDSVVLEHVTRSRSLDPAAAALEQLRMALAKDPANLPGALAFARASIRLGSEEGDPRYYGYAQAALSPWWSMPAPSSEVRILRAVILQWRHDFDAARLDLTAVIHADDAEVEQAHLTLASIDMVQGDPTGARRDCAALIGHTDLLTATVCIASANALMGKAGPMMVTLQQLLGQAQGAPPSTRLWGMTEVAEIAARTGDVGIAQSSYDAALKEMEASGHRDPYLLASAADFLLDTHQPQVVVALLKDLGRIDNLLLRLALAKSMLARGGDAEAAGEVASLDDQIEARFTETRARGDFVHQREQAIFLLDLKADAPQALTVATQNWQSQREPLDARVLLEAALAAHQPAAARPVLDWMRVTGIEDVQLQNLERQLAAGGTAP